MSKGKTSTASSPDINHLISEEVRQIINEGTGKAFEENIRGVLSHKFNFEKYSLSRNIVYRKFKTSEQTITIFKGENEKLQINNIPYILILNNDYSITIMDANKNTISKTIKEKQEKIKDKLKGVSITIFPHVEIEFDGIYKINDFISSMKFKDEVVEFYSNIGKNDDFEIAVIEAKLSPNKISKLVKQLKKYYYALEKKLNKKIIYLGFFNSPTIDSKEKANFKKLEKMKCVLYGI